MWDKIKNTISAQQSGANLGRAGERAVQPAPDGTMICCDEPMGQRLARARDRLGQTVFVAVWHCPRCGRLQF